MLRVRFFFPLLIALAAVAAACGGGGGGSVVPSPSASPTPHAGPTAVPVGPTPQAVVLTGGGYTLSFTVPPIVTGNTTTMSAVLQTSLPSGTVAPQSSKHHFVIRPLAQNFSGLVYLVVSTTDSIGFSSAPSFQYTLPAGTSIAAGSSTYILYWDPAVSNWIALLGPGTVSGQTVTFPSVQTGVQFNANTQYVFALAQSVQPVPTATPAPTPTPRPTSSASASPTPTASPAVVNCGVNYSPVSGGVPLHITDDSGLGAELIVYVSNGAGWLAANGTWNATPNPLPAACFSTTKGASSALSPLVIPTGVGGRIYFAYAPKPASSSAPIPNPFAGVGLGEPNLGYQSNAFPWDKIEFGTTSGALIDTTQVDALGLPLELAVSPNGTPMPDDTPGPCVANPVMPGVGPVGVTSCKFAAIFNTVASIPQYQPLVYTTYFNGSTTPIDMQVVSPAHANYTSFDWNLFADTTPPATAPCPSSTPYGYLSCVLASYQSTPRVFTSNVSGAAVTSPAYYCVSSDGSSNFLATNLGTSIPASTTCSATATPYPNASPSQFRIPVQTLTYGNAVLPTPAPKPGVTPATNACEPNELFSQPYGTAFVGPGQLFANNTAFAMWKALTADVNYGTALNKTQIHPVGPPLSQMFLDPMYNQYDQVMHQNFNGNLAYGIPYDDLYNLESGIDWYPNDTINVRINPIPAASSVTPASAPSAVPTPVPCPTITPGIGNY